MAQVASELVSTTREQKLADSKYIKDLALGDKKQSDINIESLSGGVYNVTILHPLQSGYYTLATALANVPSALRRLGMVITYQVDANGWETKQFIGTTLEVADWSDISKWNEFGGGDNAELQEAISEISENAPEGEYFDKITNTVEKLSIRENRENWNSNNANYVKHTYNVDGTITLNGTSNSTDYVNVPGTSGNSNISIQNCSLVAGLCSVKIEYVSGSYTLPSGYNYIGGYKLYKGGSNVKEVRNAQVEWFDELNDFSVSAGSYKVLFRINPGVECNDLKIRISITQKEEIPITVTAKDAVARLEISKYGDKFNNLSKGVPSIDKFAGKKIAIIGDSISTFGPDTENTYLFSNYPDSFEHELSHYDGTIGGITSVDKTWWRKVTDICGATLTVNAAYSGSRVTANSGSNSTPSLFYRADSSKVQLNNPDVIIVALGQNDATANVALGNYDYDTAIQDLSESSFRPAYIKGIKQLQASYPNAQIYCLAIIKGDRATKFKGEIKTIAAHYGLPYIDAGDYSIYTGNNTVHPNTDGMEEIASKVVAFNPVEESLSSQIDEMKSNAIDVQNGTAVGEKHAYYIDSQGNFTNNASYWESYTFLSKNIKSVSFKAYTNTNTFLAISFFNSATPSKNTLISGVQFGAESIEMKLTKDEFPEGCKSFIVSSRFADAVPCTITIVRDIVGELDELKDKGDNDYAIIDVVANATSNDIYQNTYINSSLNFVTNNSAWTTYKIPYFNGIIKEITFNIYGSTSSTSIMAIAFYNSLTPSSASFIGGIDFTGGRANGYSDTLTLTDEVLSSIINVLPSGTDAFSLESCKLILVSNRHNNQSAYRAAITISQDNTKKIVNLENRVSALEVPIYNRNTTALKILSIEGSVSSQGMFNIGNDKYRCLAGNTSSPATVYRIGNGSSEYAKLNGIDNKVHQNDADYNAVSDAFITDSINTFDSGADTNPNRLYILHNAKSKIEVALTSETHELSEPNWRVIDLSDDIPSGYSIMTCCWGERADIVYVIAIQREVLYHAMTKNNLLFKIRLNYNSLSKSYDEGYTILSGYPKNYFFQSEHQGSKFVNGKLIISTDNRINDNGVSNSSNLQIPSVTILDPVTMNFIEYRSRISLDDDSNAESEGICVIDSYIYQVVAGKLRKYSLIGLL